MSPVELLEKNQLQENQFVEELVEQLVEDDDELLIEEISIDGMCGVY
jgi:mycofactocin precursor